MESLWNQLKQKRWWERIVHEMESDIEHFSFPSFSNITDYNLAPHYHN